MAELANLYGGGADAEDGTFLGFPSCPNLDQLEAEIAIIGAPIATPYAALGTYAADSPRAIRAGVEDWVSAVGNMDFDLGEPLLGTTTARVVDCGDIPGDAENFQANRARIESAIRSILKAGSVPIVLGGDDSVPIPVFHAFRARGPFTVLQIDAHIDWRDEVNGEHLGLSSNMRRASEMPHIERIVQVGARAMGSARPHDYQAALNWGVHFVTGREVQTNGIQPIVDLIPNGAEILLTVDCDGLDPSIMPAVIGPAPGGLSYWQMVDLMHGVAAKARIACFNVVEFMAARDVQKIGALTAARLVCNAIGLIARQTAAKSATNAPR